MAKRPRFGLNGPKVRTIMKSKGHTPDSLAAKLNCTRPAIYNYLRPLTHKNAESFSLYTINKLANALDVSPLTLLTKKPEPPKIILSWNPPED